MYWLRQYTFPLMLALMLHAGAAWALYGGWTPDKEVLKVIKPQMVKANLIMLEAKARPAPPPKEKTPVPIKKQTPAKPKEKPKPKVDPNIAAKKKAADEAAKKAQEQAKKEQERLERLARLSELAQTSLDQAISEESEDLQAGTEEMVAQSYRAAIYELVRQNWSRPPSARNGMSAKLLVELIPTGEVVGVSVVDSSGNGAFDRSAEQAVRLAKRFEVPPENSIFESHFRRFYFLFQPEDLLR